MQAMKKPQTAHHNKQLQQRSRVAATVLRSGVIATLWILTLTLCACMSADRRSAGTVVDDQSLEYAVINNIYSDPAFGEADHIKVEVQEGTVLLAGQTVSEANRKLATRRAEAVPMTKRVVNVVEVGERADFGDKLENSWLTTKVNTRLATENIVPGWDATRIKVVSSMNTVYLMGMVTREQGNELAEVVRNIRGVKKVVKVFDYLD